MKQFTSIATTALLALGMSASANAAFVTGTIGFSDGFDSVSDIVSPLNKADVSEISQAAGGTLNFDGIAGDTITNAIDLDNPAGAIYQIGGFTFNLLAVSNIVRISPTCQGALCGDELRFNLAGIVSGNGFEATQFLGNWTSNGTCLQAGQSGNCQNGTQSGTWSSTIAATGDAAPVPEPETLALLSIGLIGFGAARRKAKQ